MGWFDKKSWQLRRKIRDLQSELAIAEREGKYVLEQGLFFAELQDMADNTIMVLGTAEHLDAEEENIIRNFFDRNGFTVEALRLDKTQKLLANVEIIPPEELTRRVARALKEDGYKLIDDSDQERTANLEKKTVTLSAIIRAILALFASHVNQLIIGTPIKMNMEGNRLLHWLPLIREATLQKVSPEVINVCREPFISAYNHYYARFGKIENPDLIESFSDMPEEQSTEQLASLDEAETEPETDGGNPGRANARVSAGASTRKPVTPLFAHSSDGTSGDRSAEAAFVLANIYKSLIGASDQRHVRNAELVLDQIARFFSAKSACLLKRKSPDAPFHLHANSHGPACLETSEDGAVKCDARQIQQALKNNAITPLQPANGHKHPQAIVAPINLNGDSDAILYLTEPEHYVMAEKSPDAEHLAMFALAFREFPDLLVGESLQKI